MKPATDSSSAARVGSTTKSPTSTITTPATWLRSSPPRPAPRTAARPAYATTPATSSTSSPKDGNGASIADSHGIATAVATRKAVSPIAMPARPQARACALTALSRCGATSSVHAIVPCRYSPAPTTTPSTSASNPLKPATESRSRTSVWVPRLSSSDSVSTTMSRTSPTAPIVMPQNVRVVRILSSSAPMSRITARPPCPR